MSACIVPRAAGPAQALPSPRPVTRGESHPTQRAAVDWLNATFPAPSMSVEAFVALLARMLGRPLSGVASGGLLGFSESVKLVAHHGSKTSAFGSLAYGGESQRGRWLLQITGVGCGFVRDWDELRQLLEDLDAKLTRVDLAVDFLEGEHSVDEAVTLHGMGGFNGSGRPPSTRVDGDWLEGIAGRTLYVGKAANGKMLRVYEKGRQLGDPSSEWVRFEVQLGARDRVIPFEALTDRDAFFCGCYPALASMLEDAGRKIETQRTEGVTTLGHLWHHMKRCYGKFVDVLSAEVGAEHAELIESVRIVGMPRRLNPSSLAAGVTWADVLAQSKGV